MAEQQRMSLAAVTSGRGRAPYRIGVYGPPGVGKTTLAAGAQAAVVIPVEDGAGRIDVARFPRPQKWADILDAIDVLRREQHQYKTVVVDTVDAAEPLCWAHVCEAAGKPDIESFGYGKGYVIANDQWRTMLARLEALQAERGMGVILVSHAAIRTFHNPLGEDYDRWTLRLKEGAAALIKDWCELVGFAAHEDFVKGQKASSSGRRLLRVQHNAAYEAKSRFDIPPEIELTWPALQAELDLATADAAALRAEFERRAPADARAAKWIGTPGYAAADERMLRAAIRAIKK